MNKHVAILGCGQLARLMAMAGKEMGIDFSFVAMGKETTQCVDGFGNIVRFNPQEPVIALLKKLGDVDAVTVEREDIDSVLLQAIDKTGLLRPGSDIILSSQNRLKEKQALQSLGIGVTPWLHIGTIEDLPSAADKFGFPLIFKSLEQGYDGKNQWRVSNGTELEAMAEYYDGRGWIAEPAVNFIAEVSMITARSLNGEFAFYSLTENEHKNGILHCSIAPVDFIPLQKQLEAQRQIRHLMTAWQYVGVMVTEYFVTEGGFLVNEIAPRVHNSGHWTQLGAKTSQFENHLRAILGMPLGSPVEVGVAGMINILGGMDFDSQTLPSDLQVHMYNKEDRPGRKLGHVNITGCHHDAVRSQMAQTRSMLKRA